ncbi:MAG: site-specific DNA-methyltransferase, partial [Fibromonadales bacterium]|nr:site-specific DNA-methyltransferase [Fibromonadales bacterium]
NNINEAKSGYSLNFVGKDYAKLKYGLATETVLKPDTEHNGKPENKDSENVFITGDNLDVLKHLQNAYQGEIKMIYIDPPYNTGKEFVYNDKFKFNDEQLRNALNYTDEEVSRLKSLQGKSSHSAWLSFMYPRLKIAQKLLSEDGVIFISIDDNEQANLKLLCNEIFGEVYFEATIIPIVNPGGRDYKQIAITNEYILIYSKSKDSEINEIQKNVEFTFSDSKGGFDFRELRNRNPKFHRGNRPNLFYPFYVNPNIKTKEGYCAVSLEKNNEFSIEVKPYNSERKESVWRWGKIKAKENIIENDLDKSQILAKQKSDGNWNIYEKSRITTIKVKSV